MTCYMLKTPTAKEGLFDATHYYAFHGIGRRRGSKFPKPGTKSSNDPARHEPLEVSRSGVFVPPIFKPHSGVNLVVSEKVLGVFLQLGSMEVIEVNFPKLIRYPLKKSVFDFDYKNNDVDSFIEDMPDDISLHLSIGRYYEIMATNTFREHASFEPEYSFEDNDGDWISFASSLPVKYLLFWHGELILRDGLYHAIKDYLDHDFFDVTKLETSESDEKVTPLPK